MTAAKSKCPRDTRVRALSPGGPDWGPFIPGGWGGTAPQGTQKQVCHPLSPLRAPRIGTQAYSVPIFPYSPNPQQLPTQPWPRPCRAVIVQPHSPSGPDKPLSNVFSSAQTWLTGPQAAPAQPQTRFSWCWGPLRPFPNHHQEVQGAGLLQLKHPGLWAPVLN